MPIIVQEDFDLLLWRRPHHRWGTVIAIDSGLVREGLGGVAQSMEYADRSSGRREIDHEQPRRPFDVSAEQLDKLIRLMDQIQYRFAQHPATGMLGGTVFGLRLTRGMQTVTLEWFPKFEDQIESVRALYLAVERLAQA